MQFQYLDVGVNIDVLGTREVSRQLALDLKAEVSSLAGSPSPSAATDPVIRQNYWQSAVLIPVGKSTVVFTSDALESKGGMQISVTATPLQ
jgi:type II secretory pathway component GspD/PulD (secretin)